MMRRLSSVFLPALSHQGTRARVFVAALVTATMALAVTMGVTTRAAGASVTFVEHNVLTQGNWKGVYGSDGFEVANDSTSDPAYATVTKIGNGSWTWDANAADVRALRQAASATRRIAATDYASASFTIDVNVKDGAIHQVALYLLDWDRQGRAESIEVVDVVSGTTLDKRSVAGFANGDYLVWRVSGHVQFEVTRTAGPNAVVSGIFFDPAVGTHPPPTVTLTQPAPGTGFVAPGPVNLSATAAAQGGATITQVSYYAGATQVALGTTAPSFPAQWTSVPPGTYSMTAHATDSLGAIGESAPVTITVAPAGPSGGAIASFVQTDVTTQGNWVDTYGDDGSTVANDHTSNPFYAQVALTGQTPFTWALPNADVRALVRVGNPNTRIASTFYSSTTFSIDVNITDAATHQIALYVLDFDGVGRAQTIQAFDAGSLQAIDAPRTISGFTGGQYLVWRVAGHVKFQVTRTAGANAVVSGIFFDTPLASPVPAAASFVSTDTSTQGNWPGVYGADGFNVVNNQASYPAYARVAATGVPAWTWNGMTADARALRKATNRTNPGDRIAATLYSSSSFSIDVNLLDGASHQVALYVLDFDRLGRGETIEVLDGVSGAVLDTRSVTAFTGGQYWVYRVTGHVMFRITRTAGANAVVSGIFFDVNRPPSIG